MTDKYSDLPDIEEGVQVFESSDVEDNAHTEEPVESDIDSDVDQSSTPAGQARSRFHRDVLVGGAASFDFSGHVGKPLKDSGYKVASVEETVDEKLARIARELEEIKLIQADTDKQKEDKKTNAAIDSLVQLVEGLKDEGAEEEAKSLEISSYNQRIEQVFKQTSDQLHTRLDGQKQHDATTEVALKQSVTPTYILELEGRINRLEALLGEAILTSNSFTTTTTTSHISITSMATNSTNSIQGQINELNRKANIIYNPEYHIKTLNEEINRLNANVEKYIANRRLAQIGGGVSDKSKEKAEEDTTSAAPSVETKINEIYSRIPDFDQMNKILPRLLTRLKSLNKVHNELGGSITTASSLDQTLGDIESDMKKWDKSLTEMSEKLNESDLQFKQNKKEVERWVQDLEKKMSGN